MNKDQIKKYDSKDVLGSITLFPKQCRGAWENIKYEGGLKEGEINPIKNILVIGMGGSALGAHIIESLNILSVPITMSHDYSIPKWVNTETLVLAMSYSGGTEETLSATDEALGYGAKVVGITTGGKLAEILKEKNIEVCIIDTKDNPCGQPRFGVGSMMMTMFKIFVAHDLCTLPEAEITHAIKQLEAWQNNNEEILDEVYKEAELIKNNILILVYAEHLTNLGRFARNQIHETSKTLALAHEIPELNHHLMEGLSFPEENKKLLHFVFAQSNLYSKKINKRFEVTKDVLHKQGIGHSDIQIDGETPLAQALIGMLRAMYFAYALAIIHQKDPSDIPWVNYFKEQLGK